MTLGFFESSKCILVKHRILLISALSDFSKSHLRVSSREYLLKSWKLDAMSSRNTNRSIGKILFYCSINNEFRFSITSRFGPDLNSKTKNISNISQNIDNGPNIVFALLTPNVEAKYLPMPKRDKTWTTLIISTFADHNSLMVALSRPQRVKKKVRA